MFLSFFCCFLLNGHYVTSLFHLLYIGKHMHNERDEATPQQKNRQTQVEAEDQVR